MLVQAIPLFQDAHLLRRNMLEALSDYTFLFPEHQYQGYADGILAGCELTTTKDTIILNEGILLFEKKLYLLREPMIIAYHPTNNLTVLKLKFSDEMRDVNFIYREMELILSEQEKPQKGEMEMCRFTLQEGARLRYEYQDFEDRDTIYDTLNRVYVPYASIGRSTLSPDITRSFAGEMLEINSITDFDALFCMQILGQNQPIGKEALKAYLKRKGIRELSDGTNHDIYMGLAKVLKKAAGEEQPEEVKQRKKWRVTVE
ncbi:MAG: hypothetical protein J1E64_07180 [Acetatifactor sp.]|nr:hypothetical protein [Acetatifactor sp.]